MSDPVVRRIFAVTIGTVFILLILSVAVRDRQLEPTVAGGLVALLSAVVALFATRENQDNHQRKDNKDE